MTRTDMVALAQAKAEIRALGRARFQSQIDAWPEAPCTIYGRPHKSVTFRSEAANQRLLSSLPGEERAGAAGMHHLFPVQAEQGQHRPPEVRPLPDATAGQLDVFTDDEILPVFEAALDLPRPLAPTPASANGASATEEADD